MKVTKRDFVAAMKAATATATATEKRGRKAKTTIERDIERDIDRDAFIAYVRTAAAENADFSIH